MRLATALRDDGLDSFALSGGDRNSACGPHGSKPLAFSLGLLDGKTNMCLCGR